ncbi:MAG: hypothetical protein P8X74_13770 [Reinekea sp.]
MNTQHNLIQNTELTAIATVTKARNGQAVTLTSQQGMVESVTGHGSQVPVLHKGDQVLVVRNTGGCFIIDRIRNDNEQPYMANHNGQLIFENQQFIGFKVKDCYIRMEANGELIIHAENLRAVAELVNEIQGNLVKLN